MKSSSKYVSAAFGALLATQSPALGETPQNLAEPFRTDVSSILVGEEGRFLKVQNLSDFAESYRPGSSVVVEGDYGLSDSVLQNLQSYINTNYSHLNVLVYLAEDGGVSRSESDVCGSNNKLGGLKEDFFNNVATGGEGQDVILYLAGTSLNDPQRMLCALISPNMAQLTGPDHRIFRPGQQLFDVVAGELRPDFNRVGAVKSFLRELDQRVEAGKRDIERQQSIHIQSINQIATELESAESGIIAQASQGGFILDSSSIYRDFQESIESARSFITGDARYVTNSDISSAQAEMKAAIDLYDSMSSAMNSYNDYGNRFQDLRQYEKEVQESPYYDVLLEDFRLFQQALGVVEGKWEDKDIDYISGFSMVQKLKEVIDSKISGEKFKEDAVDYGAGGTAGLFGAYLLYMNRRGKRRLSKKQLRESLDDFKDALTETKRIFTQEIEGTADSIDMFFGDQQGETKETMAELKKNVAYISVLLPKISEILQKVEKRPAFGSFSTFRATPFLEAQDMLGETYMHDINPDSSEVDKKLLEKINGGEEIQDMSALIDSMNQTFPELVSLLDQNINGTKDIFAQLKRASENIEKVEEENTALQSELGKILQNFSSNIGITPESSSELLTQVSTDLEKVGMEISDIGEDVLGKHNAFFQCNTYISGFQKDIGEITTKIQTQSPVASRDFLAQAGYDVSVFINMETLLYEDMFSEFLESCHSGEFQKEDYIDVKKDIIAFYEKLRQLGELEKVRQESQQRSSEIKSKKEEKVAYIKQFFTEETLTGELFVEKGSNIASIMGQATKSRGLARVAIQNEDIQGATQHLEHSLQLQSHMEEILFQTGEVASEHKGDIQELSETRSSIEARFPDVQKKLEYLQAHFDAAILQLREQDFQAEDSDKDIGNNIDEIQAFLDDAQKNTTLAQSKVKNGHLLEADTILGGVTTAYVSANARIKELTSSYKLATGVHKKNPKEYEGILSTIEDINSRKPQFYITPKTEGLLATVLEKTRILGGEFSKEKQNPYYIEDTIIELAAKIQLVYNQVLRDNQEFEEYGEHIKTAGGIWEKYKTYLNTVNSDQHPDGEKVKNLVRNISNLEREFLEIKEFSQDKVAQWYELTDRLEDFMQRCEQNIAIISKDKREREDALTSISKAKKEVKKAKSWSGTYVSIGYNIGETDLRNAYNSYNAGDFSQADTYADTAKDDARSAIRTAEKADKKEQKKRDDAAEERRRQRAASISSSSSSGGGSSGFSGGRF